VPAAHDDDVIGHKNLVHGRGNVWS
jgi:hypothetical protein